MNPSVPNRLPQEPPPTSITYTFTGSTVAPSTEAEILDQLMKSEEYKAFREDSKALTGFSVEMFKIYSGAVIAVATGVFVGSLAVVKELSTWSCNWMLGWSWGLTAAAVVFAFIELLLSQFASQRELKILEWRLHEHDYKTKVANHYSDGCRYLMVATCITLVFGVVLSATFIFHNRNAPRRSNESGSSAPTKIMADSSLSTAQRPSNRSLDSPGHTNLSKSGQRSRDTGSHIHGDTATREIAH